MQVACCCHPSQSYHNLARSTRCGLRNTMVVFSPADAGAGSTFTRCASSSWSTRSLVPLYRLVVGVAGVPGSGKTTTAEEVVSRIHRRLGVEPDTSPAIAVSMDGASRPCSYYSYPTAGILQVYRYPSSGNLQYATTGNLQVYRYPTTGILQISYYRYSRSCTSS